MTQIGPQVPGDVEGFGLQLDHIDCLAKPSGDDTALQREHSVGRLPRRPMWESRSTAERTRVTASRLR